MKLFGFELRRQPKEEPISFIPPITDDGAAVVSAFGTYGTVLDLNGTVRTDAELITKYRDMSIQPEVDSAIEDIVCEAIITEDNKPTVEIILDDINIPDNIKSAIVEEFKTVLSLFKFNVQSYDIFKRYYIDGRLFFHALVDEKNPSAGIAELRYIDPRKIRKVREIQKVKDKSNPDVIITKVKSEYYVYNDSGFNTKDSRSNNVANNPTVQGIKISKDSIINSVSGLQDSRGTTVLSYLHKAIRPLNQLRALEDATLIYRISRAPERRIFYIDVGDLPKAKAEQHLNSIMMKHKNKIVYDSQSGEIRDDRKFMTMLEDYWLPRRSDGKATEITTLPAGQNLGELADVEYFQKKLYKALNVPVSRLDTERPFNVGRSTEISRDEIKFSKFIDRLRTKFAEIFISALEKQLVLKMIITPEEWDMIKDELKFKFARDNFAAELKDSEILGERLNRMRDIDPYAGKYYSHTEIRKQILKQTDEDIKRNDEEIAAEMQIPQYNPALMPGQEPQP